MKRITATAPGKMVLLGEYAVLAGAPALVMAVDRRARVVLESGGRGYRIDAPGVGVDGAECRLIENGHIEWLGDASRQADRLGLVAAILEAFVEDRSLPPFRATLETDSFFHTARGDRAKLGLGSSAALTVALAGALAALRDDAPPPLGWLLAVHRRVQDGRGSGIDIAASLTGGMLGYRLQGDSPQAEPLAPPAGLAMRCVWSGKSASTGEFLRKVADWRARQPARYDDLMKDLGTIAQRGLAALLQAEVAVLAAACTAYAEGLARLGAASGADIVCREHREIAAIAANCGVAYKSCGAGGGDIGIALTAEVERLQEFCVQIETSGFQTLDLAVDPQGLRVEMA